MKKYIPHGYKPLGYSDQSYKYFINKSTSKPKIKTIAHVSATNNPDISSKIYIIPDKDSNGNYLPPNFINIFSTIDIEENYPIRFISANGISGFQINYNDYNDSIVSITLIRSGSQEEDIYDAMSTSTAFINGWNKNFIYDNDKNLYNSIDLAYNPNSDSYLPDSFDVFINPNITSPDQNNWLYIKPLLNEVVIKTRNEKAEYIQSYVGLHSIGSKITCVDNNVQVDNSNLFKTDIYKIKNINCYGTVCYPNDPNSFIEIKPGVATPNEGLAMMNYTILVYPDFGTNPIYKKTEFGWVQIDGYKKTNNKFEHISVPFYINKNISLNIQNHTQNQVDIEIEGQSYKAYPNAASPITVKHLNKHSLMKIKHSSGQIVTSTSTPLAIQKSQSDHSVLFVKDNDGVVNIDIYNQVAILTVSVELAGNKGSNWYATVYDGTTSVGTVYAGATESFIITSGTYKVEGDGNCGTQSSGPITHDMHVIVKAGNECLVEGTKITLADGSYKNVENLTYEDELLCWDFDNAKMTKTKPCAISKKSIAYFYYKVKLSNGSIMNLVGTEEKSHRLFNYTKQKFMYPQDFDKDDYALTSNLEKAKILSIEKIRQQVNYYSIEAYYHLNYFAEDIMCGCRFSNVYPIENMKYIKNDEQINLNDRNDYLEIPDRLWYGLRLSEQKYNDNSNVMFYSTMKEHIINNYLNREKEESK